MENRIKENKKKVHVANTTKKKTEDKKDGLARNYKNHKQNRKLRKESWKKVSKKS